MRRFIPWLFKLLILTSLGGVFALTDSPFFMVGGSEGTSFLVTPTIFVQIFALLVCAIAILVPAKNGFKIIRLSLGIVAALLGGHRLLVDNLHHRISDVYLAVPVHVLPLDPANEAGLSVRQGVVVVVVGPTGASQSLGVLSPPFIGLNRTELTALVH